jgi:hypothetical protein
MRKSSEFLILFLALCSAPNAYSEWLLGKKRDFWNSYRGDNACLNGSRDSLTLAYRDEKETMPLDTVGFLSYRDRKSWWPYLLTAAIVGASTYTYFHFTSEDDAWYTGEGKARFAGVFWGVIVLGTGGVVKEAVETKILIHPRLGIHDVGALMSCEF